MGTSGFAYRDNKDRFRYVPTVPQSVFQNKQKFHEKLTKHIQQKTASAIEKAKTEKQAKEAEKQMQHDMVVERINKLIFDKAPPTVEKFHRVQMAVVQNKSILTNDELKNYNLRLKELHTRMVTPPSDSD